MEEEIEFGPFEVTTHEIVSLIERASERILTLADLGVKGINPKDWERREETFRECLILHMTARASEPNSSQLLNMATFLDKMSVALPDIGMYGKQLAEEMNLASSRIRRMIMNELDEKGEPLA